MAALWILGGVCTHPARTSLQLAMARTIVALALLATASAFVSKTGPAVGVSRVSAPAPLQMGKGGELRDRIATVGNTQKITEAMRLVAAAKVRRAQEAVLQTRPFSETLQSVFSGLIEQSASGVGSPEAGNSSRGRAARGAPPPGGVVRGPLPTRCPPAGSARSPWPCRSSRRAR